MIYAEWDASLLENVEETGTVGEKNLPQKCGNEMPSLLFAPLKNQDLYVILQYRELRRLTSQHGVIIPLN